MYAKDSKVIVTTTILMVCVVYATAFSCHDVDTAMCKKNFGLEFQSRFKTLYVDGMKKFFTVCLDGANKLENKISGDDAMKNQLSDTKEKLNNIITKLNDKEDDDYKKLVDTVNEGFESMSIKAETAQKYRDITDEINLRESMVAVLKNLAIEIGNLWTSMYGELRPQDLNEHPEYNEVNELMENLKGSNAKPSSSVYFIKAVDILGDEFDLELFKLGPSIS